MRTRLILAAGLVLVPAGGVTGGGSFGLFGEYGYRISPVGSNVTFSFHRYDTNLVNEDTIALGIYENTDQLVVSNLFRGIVTNNRCADVAGTIVKENFTCGVFNGAFHITFRGSSVLQIPLRRYLIEVLSTQPLNPDQIAVYAVMFRNETVCAITCHESIAEQIVDESVRQEIRAERNLTSVIVRQEGNLTRAIRDFEANLSRAIRDFETNFSARVMDWEARVEQNLTGKLGANAAYRFRQNLTNVETRVNRSLQEVEFNDSLETVPGVPASIAVLSTGGFSFVQYAAARRAAPTIGSSIVYLVGGNDDDSGPPLNVKFAYNISNATFYALASNNTQVFQDETLTYDWNDDAFYTFGGRIEEGGSCWEQMVRWTPQTTRLDLHTEKNMIYTSAGLVMETKDTVGAFDGNASVLLGGRTATHPDEVCGTANANNIHRQNASAFLPCSTSPICVSRSSSAAVGNRYVASLAYDPGLNRSYVFGGNDNTAATTSIVRYDHATGATTTMTGTLPIVLQHACAVWDTSRDVAYVFGGSGTAGTRVMEYNPVNDTAFFLHPTLPSAREVHDCVWEPDRGRAYVFPGWDGIAVDTRVLNFTPPTLETTSVNRRVATFTDGPERLNNHTSQFNADQQDAVPQKVKDRIQDGITINVTKTTFVDQAYALLAPVALVILGAGVMGVGVMLRRRPV